MTARTAARTAILAALLTAYGCSSPNAANIQLRKQNQDLSSQIDALTQQNNGLHAQLQATQAGRSIPTLPEARLDQLFTAHGLSIGRLTGGYSDNPDAPDQMLKVYAVPTDDDGQPLKAAGSVSVDLLDLAAPGKTFGHWEFTTGQTRSLWFGHALLYTYILDCPWQTIPIHRNLLVNVTFTDELTGRQFSAHDDITVNPPSTQP